MKSNLQTRTPAAILLLTISLTTASAQPSAPAGPTALDPTTGLPMPEPAAQWIDPNWKDPAKVLPSIHFDGIPISEVARYLRGQFSNDFDVVIPSGYTGTNNDPNFDPGSESVTLQLRHVTASEFFRAMNFEFKNENRPVRWELMMNGNRPTALLHVLPELLPPAPPAPPPYVRPPEPKRMVYFVGNLIGDEKAGGMTMKQIGQTISQVWAKAYGQAGAVQFYEPAQLLIVTGSPDQIDFIQQTLSALRQKVELARRERSQPVESGLKKSEPKPGGSAGSR